MDAVCPFSYRVGLVALIVAGMCRSVVRSFDTIVRKQSAG